MSLVWLSVAFSVGCVVGAAIVRVFGRRSDDQ